MRRFDTVVIGGGLAGIMAALSAKTERNRVLLVAKGYGSFYHGPGVIDLLGSSAAKPGKKIVKPFQEINKLHQVHPYSKLGLETVKEALTNLSEQLKFVNYPLEGGKTNMLLPTALGSIRPTCLAPTALANGDLNHGGDILIAGIEGFHYFNALLATENLKQNLKRLGKEQKVECCTLELTFNRKRPLSAYDLALWFDQHGDIGFLAEQLRPRLGTAERVGFPAVLGLTKHSAILKQLEQELGREVFEIPTLPPCVPGIRLHRSLITLLQKKGIAIVTGYPVADFVSRDRVIKQITVHSPGRHMEYQGSKYILATGGLVGGGLVAGSGWVQETIFKLPVAYIPGVESWSRDKLFHPKGQPYAHFGVMVNTQMQPVDHQGTVCFTNLYAAGNILAHSDPLAEKSSGGIDIATGFAAGMQCRGEGMNHELQREFSGGPVLKVQHL
ncbi:anaerobic glycerol-3-phosphate dehydrogenase subunit GlpB [Zhaonella formicivorans]|uniref:anaerobic glycerol-3-phosphate dehydrogenase subunit GlpB n=1 Tax=Zhaonella formicivorans TaxID=2528593 RepID=UPI0010D397B2|nr:anaerobic glycerol-3-phosphate dehydrogenase subunit GlpB [Zhaonella formicivorans]